MTSFSSLEKEICRALCTDISFRHLDDGSVLVSTPFTFPDGDVYSIYLKPLPLGGFRITDMGVTMMRLSYENDVSIFTEGIKEKVFNQILSEMSVSNNKGEFYLEVPANELTNGIFTFGQAITRIHDLPFLNRVQVESSFMEDLKDFLENLVGQDKLIEDYTPANVPDAENYRSDFAVRGNSMPVLIWGVSNASKARLATIVMQHLQKNNFLFKSLVVYSDMGTIPRSDLARLTSAANDQVPSLNDREPIERKLRLALA